jgi:hypothetical protein
MPPTKEQKPLSSTQIATLTRWISEGAPYAKHWAFEAPKPATGAIIDDAVQAKLTTLKLQPSPRADAVTLVRRLHLDLVGLPPSPADVQAFESGIRSLESEITRLMATPQFGEKWARHWLDAARYSDSNGYEKDLVREQWSWRDWVISAFNNDMPYDQFITEQIAGDMLPKATQEQIVATGFLRNSMINEEGAIVPEQFRMDEMFDRLDCLGKAVLGLSVQCAQCHSHKFDPISHEDYYGLFAFLNNSYEAQSWVYTPAQQAQVAKVHSAVAAAEAKVKTMHPQWQAEMAAWEATRMKGQPAWTPLKAIELHSTGGLNHPTLEADLSIMTQGHPTTKGDIFAIFEPELDKATGLRVEALCHGDMPMHVGAERDEGGATRTRREGLDCREAHQCYR